MNAMLTETGLDGEFETAKRALENLLSTLEERGYFNAGDIVDEMLRDLVRLRRAFNNL
jgi:hypothetical protein